VLLQAGSTISIYKGGDSRSEQVSCSAPAILTPDETLTGLYKGSISTMPGVSCLDAPTLLNYIYPVFQGGRSYNSISCGEPFAMGKEVDVYRGGSSTVAALACSDAGGSLTDGASIYKGGKSKVAALSCKSVTEENPNGSNLYSGDISRANRLDCADASSSLGDVMGCYNGGASAAQALACFDDPCIELKPATITASGVVPICKGKTLTLTGSEATKYQWMRADTPTGEWTLYGTTKSIDATKSGYFKLIAIGSKGCSKESKVFFAEFNDGIAKPTIDVGGSATICLNGSVPLTSSKAYKYSWTTGATTPAVEADKAGTYQVTVEDENGCVATSDPVEIKQANLPSPTAIITAGGPTEFCKGGSVTLTSVDAAYYRWSNGATTKSIAADASDGYTVRIGDANGCEATSAPVAVTVHSLEPKLSASSKTICYGKPVELSVLPTGKTVVWFRDGAIASELTGATVTTDKAGSYEAKVTDEFGCDYMSDKVDVISNGTVTPLATITSSRTTLCQSGSVTLTAPAAESYQWSTLDKKKEITILAAGNYSVTVTDSYGCPSTASVEIKEVPVTIKPIIVPSGATALCPGTSINLTASEGSTFAWSSGETTKSITVSAAGSYRATVYDANGCDVQTPPVDVSVYPVKNPVVEPMGKTILCAGDALELRTMDAKSYAWSNGATTPSVVVNSAGSYSVTITDDNGCHFTSPALDVTQFTGAVPQATISASAPAVGGKIYLCPGDHVTLEANEAATYQWSTGESTRAIDVDKAGKYSVALTYGSSCTSVSQEVEVIIRSKKPVITASGRTNICPGEKVTLTVDGGSAFTWNSGQTTQSIEAGADGSYSAIVIDEYGCTQATDPVAVSVLKVVAPTIAVAGNANLCMGEATVLKSSKGEAYQWSTGEVSESITVKDAGIYSVTVTDANGCSATSAGVTIAKHPTRTPTIEASGALTLCQGSELTLTAPADGASYQWSNGETSKSITIKEDTKFGTFKYAVAVTYPEGCTYSSPDIFVKVNRNPNKPEIFSIGSNDICPDPSIALIATQSDSYSYEWSTGATSFGIVATKPDTYWVKVADKVTGCSSRSDDLLVDKLISAKVTIDPQGPINLCDVGSVTLNSSISNAKTYRWSSGEETPSISVNAPGYYRVTITNEKGCSQTSDYVEVRSGAQIPEPTITADGATTFCKGGSVKLSCSLSKNYQWRKDGVDIATANLKYLMVTEAGSYTVVVTDNSGCKKESRAMAVKVNPLPKATILPAGKVPLCAGAKVTLTASDAAAYLWSNGKTDKQLEVDTPGQTYTVEVVDGNGCKAQSAPVEVVAATVQAPAPSAAAVTICQGDKATLSATSTIDNPMFTWYSSAAGGAAIGAGASLQTAALNASASYWVAVHNDTQCESARAEVKVTVNAKPTVSFDLPASTCASAAPINLVGLPAGGTFSGSGVTGGLLDPKGLSGDVAITYTISGGCEASLSKTIKVDNIDVSLVPDPTGMVEAGTPVSFTATTSAAGTCTYEFFVNGASVQQSSSNIYTTDALANGDKVLVKVTSAATGCWAKDSLLANVRQPISWEEPSGNVACALGNTVFRVSAYAGYTYAWRLGDAAAGGIIHSANPNEVTITWTNNSYFGKGVIMMEVEVLVDYTNASGKTQTLSRKIKLYRRPETGAVYGQKNGI
jgi:large repetitive protein